MKGKLIVLEGLNGSGKTTQAKRLAREMPGVYMHEVGSHRTSSFPVLLKRLLSMDNLDPITEQYFITGSRIFNLQWAREILDLGHHVIYDRYIYSSHIYSHREVKYQPEVTDAIWDLHNVIPKNILPDLTIVIDIDPQERKRRLQLRGKQLDKYEDVPDQLIEYRRNIYNALTITRSNCHWVDGSNSEDVVFGHIRNILIPYRI